MKITIRQSITSLVIASILILSFSLIAVTQFTFNKFLVRFAVSFIQKANLEIKSQVAEYLKPLNTNLLAVRDLIAKGVIVPEKIGLFKSYMLEIMKQNPQVRDYMWGNAQGELISLRRISKDHLYLMHMTRDEKGRSLYSYALISPNGGIGPLQKISNIDYDPRNRPWYRLAVEKNKPIWTPFYRFHHFLKPEDPDESSIGFSAAVPVYKNNQLLGVFSMNISLRELAEQIKKIDITPNSNILIVNHKNEILSIKENSSGNDFRGKKITPAILQSLGISADLMNMILDQSPTDHASTFKGFNKEYFLTYKILPNVAGLDWRIALIIPVADILGPLKKQGAIALGITFLIILASMIIAARLARKMTKPITQLAKEAEAIEHLKFDASFKVKSKIVEINAMVKAFHSMEKGLKSFESYVPTDLVKKLLRSGRIASLGGEFKSLSILFADIEGFTSITENMQSDKLMHFLSLYFQEMTQIILYDYGTIDKYIGDAIVAFWNAPLEDDFHALHSCNAALSMVRYLKTMLNAELKKHGYPSIKIRIGINTGKSTVGNVGSKERLSYTAIGDHVNLTSRLQEINKIYGTTIIVSEYTYQKVQLNFLFRLVDHVAVRGKTKGIFIYELLGKIDEEIAFDLQQYNNIFAKAFAKYQQGLWLQAIESFQELMQVFPNDKLASLYLDRCQYLSEENPKEWNGIWIMH